jgi:preprotein translocase subunit SecB
MTDKNKPNLNTQQSGVLSEDQQEQGQQPQQQGPLAVVAQYVKDLSFENPHAPATLRPNQPAPNMDINIGLNMEQVNEQGIYEVIMHAEARATRPAEDGKAEQVVFVVELDYALLVSAENVPERQRHPVLMIEVPKLGFPFVRQILADVTSQGGYPPVLINPIDFEGMYIQQYQQQQEQATKQ